MCGNVLSRLDALYVLLTHVKSMYMCVCVQFIGKTPTLPIRLFPPAPRIDFMGRVEVFYNNSWGTICDDAFGIPEANVICQSLNFSSALCHVREAGLGRGSGEILYDHTYIL